MLEHLPFPLAQVGDSGCRLTGSWLCHELAQQAAALFGVMGALGHVAYATFSLITIKIVDAAPGRDSAIESLDSINGDAAIGLLVMPLIVV